MLGTVVAAMVGRACICMGRPSCELSEEARAVVCVCVFSVISYLVNGYAENCRCSWM